MFNIRKNKNSIIKINDDYITDKLEIITKDDITKLVKERDKYKEVLDKIKKIITSEDICIDTRKTDGSMDYVDLKQIILELLEEIDV